MLPEFFSRLPLPLAQAYLRLRNARESKEKHDAAYFLLEAVLKFLAILALGEFLALGKESTERAARLPKMARPSIGHWVQLLRTLAAFFSDSREEPPGRLVSWVGKLTARTRDLPLSLAFAGRLAEKDRLRLGFRSSVAPLDLLEILPAYRNRHMAHSAPALKSFYDQFGPLLSDAAGELLAYLPLLPDGRELIYLEERRESEQGTPVLERLRFMGMAPLRLSPLPADGEETAIRRPGTLCLAGEGGEPEIPLFPWLHGRWEDEKGEVFFFNGMAREDAAEYLSYSSGELSRVSGVRQYLEPFLPEESSPVWRESLEERAGASSFSERISGWIRFWRYAGLFLLVPVLALLGYGGWRLFRGASLDTASFQAAVASRRAEAAREELDRLQRNYPADSRVEEIRKAFRSFFSPDFGDEFLAGLEFWQAPDGWKAGGGKLAVRGPGFGTLRDKFYDDFQASFNLSFANARGAVWILRARQDLSRYFLFQLSGSKASLPGTFTGWRFADGKMERVYGPTAVGANLGKEKDQYNILVTARKDAIEHFISTAEDPSEEPLSLGRVAGLPAAGGTVGFGTREGEEFDVRAFQIVALPDTR